MLFALEIYFKNILHNTTEPIYIQRVNIKHLSKECAMNTP